MVGPSDFTHCLLKNGVKFYSGVPETTMRHWISDISEEKGVKHVPATNEGEAVSLCAGYHLATGELCAAYMQNSGLGNALDPLTSLANKEVYSIPVLLLIGLRGERGTKDEPQHIKMGRMTMPLLECAGIPHARLGKRFESQIREAVRHLKERQTPYALIMKKGFFSEKRNEDKKGSGVVREEAIEMIIDKFRGDAVFVSTTGLTSRELFELREKRGESHGRDFYNVGAMGHCSALAAGISLGKPSKKVVVLDGDGSVLMHAGNLATIGHWELKTLVHVVFDNNCYESTGSQTSVSGTVDFGKLARSLGYRNSFFAGDKSQLEEVLGDADKKGGPIMIAIKTRSCFRKNLGRPTRSPLENKRALMEWLHDH